MKIIYTIILTAILNIKANNTVYCIKNPENGVNLTVPANTLLIYVNNELDIASANQMLSKDYNAFHELIQNHIVMTHKTTKVYGNIIAGQPVYDYAPQCDLLGELQLMDVAGCSIIPYEQAKEYLDI